MSLNEEIYVPFTTVMIRRLIGDCNLTLGSPSLMTPLLDLDLDPPYFAHEYPSTSFVLHHVQTNIRLILCTVNLLQIAVFGLGPAPLFAVVSSSRPSPPLQQAAVQAVTTHLGFVILS